MKHEWKKTDGMEIDLADLLHKLAIHWKHAAACALVAAAIFGGIGYSKARAAVPVQDPEGKVSLTQEEQEAVTDALELRAEYDGLMDYMDNSILMQLDPYHKHKCVMLYSIEGAGSQSLAKITESYISFVSDGGVADVLKKSGKEPWDLDKSYLAEVISAYQKPYTSPYQVAGKAFGTAGVDVGSLFYVEAIGKDAAMASQLADGIQEALEKYMGTVAADAGSHKLILASRQESVVADTGLQAQQRDRRAALSSNKDSLESMTKAFNAAQLAAYKEAAGMEPGQGSTKQAMGTWDPRTVMKYVLFGLAGGAFLYCCAFAAWYLSKDTLKSAREMEMLYAFPVYAGICCRRKQAKGNAAGSLGQGDYGKEEERLLGRVRLACKKQGITKLCLACLSHAGTEERACMESIAARLKEWGIEASIAGDAASDAAAWDIAAESGNVLVACMVGSTTHQMVDSAMGIFTENGIAVLGAVAFL